MMIFGIAVLGAGATFLLLLALRAMLVRNRSTSVAAALTRAGVAQPDLRAMQTARPASERVLRPLLRRLYRMGRALTPSRNIEQLQQNLILAGLPGGLTVTDFLGLRFLAGASLAVLLFTVMAVRDSASTGVLYGSGAFLVGLYLPNFWLRSKVKSRKKAVGRALPDALDMMSICVDAGLGFEAAIQKVGSQWDNELALELRRVISEIRVGVPRSDALHHLAERTGVQEVASFVAVLVQADRLGIAIRNVLNTQSVQMRIRRRQMAQEEARKAPLKMMIPLVLFIFPALFAIVLGPAVPRMIQAFS
jgi:tight adherence protein C